MNYDLKNEDLKVFTGGYRFVELQKAKGKVGKEGRYLIEQSEKYVQSRFSKSATISMVNLASVDFLQFIKIKTQNDVVNFANEYGFLGGLITESILDEKSQEEVDGESLDRWFTEVRKLANAVEIRAAIQGDDKAWLSSKILLSKIQGKLICSLDLRPFPVGQKYIDAAEYQQIENGKYQSVANHFLNEAINTQLHSNLGAKVVLMGIDERKLEITPSNLLSALWYKFAIGREQYKRCSECASWFSPPLGRGRRDKLYCSNACKVKAYRSRKAEAINLYSQGWELNKIEKKTGIEINQLRKWINSL
jgi:hypothetical protein